MGTLGGALGGGFSALGSSFLGNFGNSFGYSLLSNAASGTVTNAIYGNSITLGSMGGIVAGGLIGSVLPRYNALSGGAFKNTLAETGINVGRGAVTGFASGLAMSAIDNNKNAIWQNTVGGAISGAGSTLATIGIFGAGKIVDDSYISHGKDRPVHRSGGLASLFYSEAGISWGRTAYSGKDSYASVSIHESYHYQQQKELGFANFYGRTVKEYINAFIKHGDWQAVYEMDNTLEKAATEFEYKWRNNR